MKRYSITIDFACGSLIELCAEQSIGLANRMDCSIRFDYNGVECHAYPQTDPASFVSAIRIAMRQPKPQQAFSSGFLSKLSDIPSDSKTHE